MQELHFDEMERAEEVIRVKELMGLIKGFTTKHWIAAGIFGAVLFATGFLFFNHPLPGLLFVLFAPLYPIWKAKHWEEQRKLQLAIQFKQALEVISSYIAAGRSVESAFRECLKDLVFLFPDPNSPIMKELRLIVKKLDHGEPVEKALTEFSLKADQEDIRNFAEVFVMCKRNGGSLVEVLSKTVQMIGEKLEIQQDIAVLIAQKKFESKVLMGAPFAFLFLLKISSPDYMAPLYSGQGRLIMIISMLMLGLCAVITKKITDIKV
ncbi:type II secretion system F family protein [Marinicrinis lubricantis]|uniref:Type II secretion system F family protein n=1 Tax=Marinicrinis lubricantis TaxID=2086470 RepID=A0ABW1ITJ4_9BACL